MNQRTALVSESGGMIAQAGAGVAGSLAQLGYTISQGAKEIQEQRDVSMLRSTFNDISAQSSKIYSDNKDNPQGFQEVFQTYSDKLVESTPAHLRGRVRDELTQNMLRRQEQVASNFEQKQKRVQLGEAFDFNVNASNEILTAYRAGNIQHAERLMSELSVSNTESGLYDPEDISRMNLKLKKSGMNQLILGEGERALKAGGLKELELYRNEIEKNQELFDNPEDKDGAMGVIDGMIRAETQRLNQIKAEQKAKLAATQKIYSKQAKGLSEVLSFGYEVDSEQVNDIAAALDVLDLKEQAQELNRAFAGRDFARLNAVEREQVLNKLIEKNPAEYSYFKDINNKVSALEKSDPLTHYQRQGKVTLPQVDYNDPQSIAARNQAVEEIKSMTGRTDIPLLTDNEQRSLVGAFNQMPANQKTAVVGQIVSGLREDSIPTLNSIAGKQGAQLALAGQLFMDGAPQVAESIFMGQEIMLNMKEIMPKDTDFNTKLEAELMEAYSINPTQRKAVIDGIKAVYADMSIKEGDRTGEVDSERLKKAVTSVTGGLIDYESGRWAFGGKRSRLEPPVRGMTSEEFEDWIDSIQPEDIEAMGGANIGSREAVRILKEEAQLVSVRVVGKTYPVYVINTPSGALAKKDGTTLYLEYTRGK